MSARNLHLRGGYHPSDFFIPDTLKINLFDKEDDNLYLLVDQLSNILYQGVVRLSRSPRVFFFDDRRTRETRFESRLSSRGIYDIFLRCYNLRSFKIIDTFLRNRTRILKRNDKRFFMETDIETNSRSQF